MAFTAYCGTQWAQQGGKGLLAQPLVSPLAPGAAALGSSALPGSLDLKDQSGLIWNSCSTPPLPGVRHSTWNPLSRRLELIGTLDGPASSSRRTWHDDLLPLEGGAMIVFPGGNSPLLAVFIWTSLVPNVKHHSI